MSFAKSLNPIADYESHCDEQDRIERNSIYLLSFDDLLGTDKIVVRGIPLEATVSVTLRKDGIDGAIEVDYCDYRAVYVSCADGELIEISSPQRGNIGNPAIDKEFHLEVLKRALAKAKLTPDYKWERKDEE